MEIQLEHEVHAVGFKVKEGLLPFLGFVLVLVVGRRARVVAASAVDEDVARAEVSQHLLMHRFQRLSVQHVRLVALADEAFRGQLVRQLLHGFLIQVQRRDFRARLRIRPCHLAAQHAARTRHNDHFPGKIHVQRQFHHCFFSPYID